MPTYEFRCPDGHEFERFYRKISDAPSELACPDCGAVATRQLSAGAGLLFKGSGFYLTDYGKNAHRKGAPSGGKGEGGKGEGGKAEGAASGGEGKPSDSKPSESKASTEKASTPPKTSGGGDKT